MSCADGARDCSLIHIHHIFPFCCLEQKSRQMQRTAQTLNCVDKSLAEHIDLNISLLLCLMQLAATSPVVKL